MSSIRTEFSKISEKEIKEQTNMNKLLAQALPLLTIDRNDVKKVVDAIRLEINQEITTSLNELENKKNIESNVAKIEHARNMETTLLKIDLAIKPSLVIQKMLDQANVLAKFVFNEMQLSLFDKSDLELRKSLMPDDKIRKLIQNGELIALFENINQFFHLIYSQFLNMITLYNQNPDEWPVIELADLSFNTESFKKEFERLNVLLMMVGAPFEAVFAIENLKTEILSGSRKDSLSKMIRQLIDNGEATKLINNINEFLHMNLNMSMQLKSDLKQNVQKEEKEAKVATPIETISRTTTATAEDKLSYHPMWRRSQTNPGTNTETNPSGEPAVKKRRFGS